MSAILHDLQFYANKITLELLQITPKMNLAILKENICFGLTVEANPTNPNSE